jgi:hypothetical protein
MPDTGSGQWPYPNSSATPDVPADILLLAQRNALMSEGWTSTANATTRAALVTNGDAFEGLRVYQIDTGVTYKYLSSAWEEWESDWISWATVPTNLTVGTGGSAATVQRYKWINGRLYFDYRYVLGSSGSSMGTQPTINLPLSVTLRIPANNIAEGDGGAYDLSITTGHFTKHLIATATTVFVRHTYTGSATSTISSTAPFTWAAGDVLAGGFWADPA